jgi:hypothetical protein
LLPVRRRCPARAKQSGRADPQPSAGEVDFYHDVTCFCLLRHETHSSCHALPKKEITSGKPCTVVSVQGCSRHRSPLELPQKSGGQQG